MNCVRCGGELEIIAAGIGACKDCKKLHADHGGDDYDELICVKKDGTFQPVFWINDQPSLQCPVVFAYLDSPTGERYYVAGSSITTIKDCVKQLNLSPILREALTIVPVDETEVQKLNFIFFDVAKKTVSEYQHIFCLGKVMPPHLE